MSTVKSKKLQVGTDATSSNNFTIYQPATPDGTLRIGVGNADSPTEVARFDSTGMVGGGKVLQVVNSTTTSASTTTSSSFVTTGKSASITPASTSNKILILVNAHYDTTNGNAQSHCTIYRDATNLGDATYGLSSLFDGGDRTIGGMSMMYLDSPSTTSSTTYTIYIKSGAGNTTVIGMQGVPTTITLLEVAG